MTIMIKGADSITAVIKLDEDMIADIKRLNF